MAISYHSNRRGFVGFLLYITGLDGVARGGVIPATTLVDSSGNEITSFGGGGASTVADGANVVEGATTDAVVAAGAAGTLSAKLRRLTTDLGALILQIPASLGIKTAAASLSIAPASDASFVVAGNVGSGVADSGNPVKAGGVYNTTYPTFTNGQRGDLQLTARGRLAVSIEVVSATGSNGLSLANVGFLFGNTTTSSNVLATLPYISNGTTLDLPVKPNATARLLSSAATTNATSVKATAGNVFKIIGNNTVASKRYLKLYNKASAPTVGTDTPVMTFVLAASAPFAIDLGASVGHYFSTGIAYAITGAAADNDTTAIASGDIECLNLTYA